MILLAWRGAHAWVMTGFRATPTRRLARREGHRRLRPRPVVPAGLEHLGSVRRPGRVPGRGRDGRNYLPWQRPEGAYPGRDGNFIALAPTQSVGKAEALKAG